MHDLEQRGLLDRDVEDLPHDADIDERGTPLTRPELAVLLAYAKIDLFDRLLDSSVPDDPYLGRELMRYFPPAFNPLSGRHREPPAAPRNHLDHARQFDDQSRRTHHAGAARRSDRARSVPDIAAAFAPRATPFALTELNTELDALDNRISGALQLELYATLQDLLLGAARPGSLQCRPHGRPCGRHHTLPQGSREAGQTTLPNGSPAAMAGSRSGRPNFEAGVPEDLAQRLAADSVDVAGAGYRPRLRPHLASLCPRSPKTYFCLGEHFRLGQIERSARRSRHGRLL
jgi:glutamate dehydrogenase